jgi:cellulose biosynthesis protein BcsQ
MPIAPDDVLSTTLRTLTARATGPGRVCIVRDARGRVRVAIEANAVPDLSALERELARELGNWFAGPVVDGAKGSPAHRRIATELLRSPEPWPADWPTECEQLDGSRTPIPAWITGRAVLGSKESWLAPGGTPPPAPPPRVVSFYSFKGGVGRTTTLGCVAVRLAAERGLKVVAMDLDLEAPGTGTFLGAPAGTGVVDHVLSYLATGEVGEVIPEPVASVPNLWVIPAGALGPRYLEKLARLDFLAGASAYRQRPTEAALRALLDAVAASVKPDVVLLDSREGLHDLGGLALHRLSHTDVLIARANEQARDGFKVVLHAIRRLRAAENRDVRIVQTMVPLPFDSEIARPLVERWRSEMYEVCLETIYEDLNDVPGQEEEAAHYPLLVGERAEFTRADRISQVAPELLPHFDRIADVVAPPPEEEE